MNKLQTLSIPTRMDSAPYEAFKRQTHQGSLNQNRSRYIKARTLLEFLITFIGLIFSLPVFFIIGILIKTTSRGPVFYAQERLGINKKPFIMYKFRTLVPGSEDIIGAKLLKAKDNLVTPLGNFLRDTRLDELPQLFNILKGDMVFFGPRPERPVIYEKICKYINNYDMRFTFKPGLIGYSQLFTAHGSPKRIRTVIDNNFIKRKQIFLWEIIFVIYTILLVVYIILFKIAKFVWNDILRKRFLIGYKEKRKLERIRFKSASIQIGTIVNGKEVFIADGELENINEDAFLIKTKHKIEKENTLFKLTTQYKNKFRKNSKQKVALCNGKIYKEIETNDNYFKYYYVIKYIPNSSLNYYYIYQYFLKESML